jgi:hypothetical protein
MTISALDIQPSYKLGEIITSHQHRAANRLIIYYLWT